MFTKLFRTLWGDFSIGEIKKFSFLSVIFGVIIGVYWTLRPLKDGIFMSMVGVEYQPYAKIVSLLAVFPIVIFYSKIVDKFPRQKVFYAICGLYALVAFVMAGFMAHPTIGLLNKTPDAARILGWIWYIFIESFGSLVVAMFWGFAADITTPDSAKKGYYFVGMGGQVGQIMIPLVFTQITPIFFSKMAYLLNIPVLSTSVPTIVIAGLMMLLIALLVAVFIRVIPQDQLKGYKEKSLPSKPKTGFLEGLKLLATKPYLLGIFAIITIFEVVVTIIDFAFKSMISAGITDEVARSAYLGRYGIVTGILSLTCIILGASNIQRKLGLSFTLSISPILVAIAVITMLSDPGISVLFWIMVFAKGFNYALNQPSIQQLYIPTSKNTKYKAKAWSDMFGSRSAKAIGSGINTMKKGLVKSLGPMEGAAKFLALSSYASLGLIAVWFIIAPMLGLVYKKAVDKGETVC